VRNTRAAGRQDYELEVSYRDIFNNSIGIRCTYTVDFSEVDEETLVHPVDTQLNGFVSCSDLRR